MAGRTAGSMGRRQAVLTVQYWAVEMAVAMVGMRVETMVAWKAVSKEATMVGRTADSLERVQVPYWGLMTVQQTEHP